MNQKINLNGENIIIIIAIFAGIVLLVAMIYKMLRKCCLYSVQNGFQLFGIFNTSIYMIPFVLIGIRIYFNIEVIKEWVIYLAFILFILVPILYNLITMGFLYGISISLFRIIAGGFGICFAWGIFAIAGIAIIGGIFVVDEIYGNSFTPVLVNGELVYLSKVGSGYYTDMYGNIYTNLGHGVFITENGETVYVYNIN